MKPKTWNSNKIEYGIIITYKPLIIFYSVLHKKVNLIMPHYLIRCRLLIALYPNVFKPLYIYGSNHLNHNYKVLITLHLGLHIENDGPHTPCSHAKKFKNVARG
jgi:hypothetical protein